MNNYLSEIEYELKQLKLLNVERGIHEIDALTSFLIEDSLESVFYMESVFDKVYFENKCNELFQTNESVVIETIVEEEGKSTLKLLVNGQSFSQQFSHNEYADLKLFFSFLVEINNALTGEFLRVPISFSESTFLGIYIADASRAKKLKKLFSLYAITSEENSELRFTVYPAKIEQNQLSNLQREDIEEHLSFETGRNISLVSSDKKLFFLGGADGNIYIWNRKDKSLEATLSGHDDHVNTIALHPHKNLLISGACMGDGRLKVWDSKNYNLLQTIGNKTHPKVSIDSSENRSYTHLTFTPDGKCLLAFYTRGDEERMLELFECEDFFRKIEEIPLPNQVKDFVLSPKGDFIALYLEEKELCLTFIQVLKLDERGFRSFNKFYASLENKTQLLFNNDATYLFESSKNKKIRQLWELDKESFSLTTHQGYVESSIQSRVLSVALFLEKNLLAIQYPTKIAIWNSISFKKLIEIEDKAFISDEVTFSEDGEWISKNDEEKKVWNIASGEELFDDNKKEKILASLATSVIQKNRLQHIAISDSLSDLIMLQSLYFEEDERTVYSLIFLNIKKRILKRFLIDNFEEEVSTLSLILDNEYLCMAQSGGLRIWSLERQEELVGEAYTTLLRKSLTLDLDEIEEFWTKEKLIEEEQDECLFFSKAIWTHSFDPKGEFLVLGTDIGLDFWHLPTQSLLESWEIRDKENYLKRCTQIAYLKNNRLALLISGKLYILEQNTQKLLYIFPNVESFTFHEEKEILAFSNTNALILFSTSQEEIVIQLSLENPLDTLAFNSDAMLLAGSQIDNYLTVWDSETLKPIHSESSGQENYCDNYAKLFFTPDGKELVAFQSWKNEVHVRQLHSFFPWRKWAIINEFNAKSIAFHPKGNELAWISEEGKSIELFFTKGWQKKEKIALQLGSSSIDSLGYSFDGKWLLFIDEKGMTHLYNRHKNNEKLTLISGRKGHWVSMKNQTIHDSGSLQVVPKNLMESLV